MEWMTGECTFTVLLTRNPTLYCNNDYSSSMLLQKKKKNTFVLKTRLCIVLINPDMKIQTVKPTKESVCVY